jgi:hypothetical protein
MLFPLCLPQAEVTESVSYNEQMSTEINGTGGEPQADCKDVQIEF